MNGEVPYRAPEAVQPNGMPTEVHSHYLLQVRSLHTNLWEHYFDSPHIEHLAAQMNTLAADGKACRILHVRTLLDVKIEDLVIPDLKVDTRPTKVAKIYTLDPNTTVIMP